MKRKIKSIQDVVEWHLCVGCGACFYMCNRGAVELVNLPSTGIRPKFKKDICKDCQDCLPICPGYTLYTESAGHGISAKRIHDAHIGSTLGIYEGHASDEEIRHRASSGGILTAIALYCLEKENMALVLHTGMDQKQPWLNVTVQSKNRSDLLANCGSRYAPSSPCDSLSLIESSKKPCIFIGKPCDALAVALLRKQRPDLCKNLGLVMSFFCAGPPCTQATIDLVQKMGVNRHEVSSIQYRGKGWPGDFVVTYGENFSKTMSYRESWGALANEQRAYRCHICPDGLGEYADISCGDAWHRYQGNGDPGRSLILARSEVGQDIINKVAIAGYIEIENSDRSKVLAAQGLPRRHKELFGRLLAMRLFLIPTPKYARDHLFDIWSENSLSVKIRTILGTFKRILLRGLWHRSPLSSADQG